MSSIADIQWLDGWIAANVPILNSRGSSRTAELYGERGKIEHFRRLSQRVLTQIGDLVLTKAAFLHGIDLSDLPLLNHLNEVDAEVAPVLQDRARLRSIGEWGGRNQSSAFVDRAELSRLLVGNVLPKIRNARAVALFVIEQLAELDEAEVVAQWTTEFARTPKALPENFGLAEPRDRFASREERSAFLRYVVGATAKFFGMWHERNVAENLALLHGNAKRFTRVLDFVLRDGGAQGKAAELAAMVNQKVPPDLRRDVHWEWHHLAAIEQEIGADLKYETWTRRFDRTGFVVVNCAAAADCYTVLHHLHASFEYIPAALRDKIGQPESSGYRAIHTTLVRRDLDQELVPVHIVVGRDEHRVEKVDGEQLARIAQRTSSDENVTIRVFAPDGRAYDIPPGSLVMNFAHAVHRDLLAHLRGATLNRRAVRPNAMLEDGDVVWLDIADTPQHLPMEWFEQLPPGTSKTLWRDYTESSKPALITAGRRWLRARVEAAGCKEILDDRQIDQLVADINLVALNPEIRGVRGVLRQIGLLDAQERGESMHRTPLIDRAAADSLAEAVIARAKKSIRLVSELDVPLPLRQRAVRVEPCLHCTPHADEDLVGNLDDDNVLTVHRAYTTCAVGQRIERVRRSMARQYFVIETNNRVGIARDVLEVFQRHDVDIEDLTGRRIGRGWGVIRVATDFLALPRQQAIRDDLKTLGVQRIVMPHEDAIPILEEKLPKRTDGPDALWNSAEPYYVGPAIDDDRHFYGMTSQLESLWTAYKRAIQPSSRGGVFGWITGPLRTGKSSIARQFIRYREQDTVPPLVAYYTAARQRWRSIVPEIGKEILKAAELKSDSLPPSAPLQAYASAARAGIDAPLIIAIDEISGVLCESTNDAAEITAIEDFYRAVCNMPRVFVILIGPYAPTSSLNDRISNVLQAALPVRAGALSPPDVKRMLRAEKMGLMYNIHLDPGVADRVHELTAGNVFWINRLALQMWNSPCDEEAASNFASEKTLTTAAVEHAKTTLITEQGVIFNDRVPRTGHEIRIIQTLIRNTASNARGIDKDALLKIVAGDTGAGREIEAAFKELINVGTVAIATNNRCRISAPILHEYLQRHLGVRK